MKKLLILTLLVMFSISLVSASDFETHKINTDFDLVVSSNDALNCNLTYILYPNGSNIIYNFPLNKDGTTFSLKINKENYTSFGNVCHGLSCNDGSSDETGSLCISITKLGDEISLMETIFYIVLIIAILILFSVFFGLFLYTPYSNITEETRDGPAIVKVTKTKYVKLISLWFSVGLFMWFMTIVSSIANNYIFFGELSRMISNLGLFINYLGYLFSTIMVFVLLYLGWKDIIFNKTILEEGKALLSLK